MIEHLEDQAMASYPPRRIWWLVSSSTLICYFLSISIRPGVNFLKCLNQRMKTELYAKAVQLSRCWRFDHRILLTALGIIHANAIQAPKRSNSRSVTVATATPTDTTVSARTCNFFQQKKNLVIKGRLINNKFFFPLKSSLYLLVGNSLCKEHEFSKNNSWRDSNLSHLIKTHTVPLICWLWNVQLEIKMSNHDLENTYCTLS